MSQLKLDKLQSNHDGVASFFVEILCVLLFDFQSMLKIQEKAWFNMSHSFLDLQSLASELEEFIQSVVSGSVPVKKYGGTLFTVQPPLNESQFCGVFIYKKHVQISFSNGAQLNDPKGMLQGAGKYRRHINFTSTDVIEKKYLAKLLNEAVLL